MIRTAASHKVAMKPFCLQFFTPRFTSTSLQELSASQQEELQQRAAYLRQQRDKLHALKKEQQQKNKLTSAAEEAHTPTLTTTTTTTPVTTPCCLHSFKGRRSGSRNRLLKKVEQSLSAFILRISLHFTLHVICLCVPRE